MKRGIQPGRKSYRPELFYELQHSRCSLIFSILTVFIACLGLFGLVSYSVTARRREIAIRKTNGANSFEIMKMVISNNIKPILYSSLISIPLAYYLMTAWLKNFAYRIQISAAWFILVIVILFLLGVLTTFYQALRASRVLPADALRTE